MLDSIIKWPASDLSGKKLKALEEVGMLPNKDLIKWRSAAGEHFPRHEEGEIPVFLAYVECGFRLPVHPFLPRVLEYYGVELVNLAPILLPTSVFLSISVRHTWGSSQI